VLPAPAVEKLRLVHDLVAGLPVRLASPQAAKENATAVEVLVRTAQPSDLLDREGGPQQGA
jgi:hypothetical protein